MSAKTLADLKVGDHVTEIWGGTRRRIEAIVSITEKYFTTEFDGVREEWNRADGSYHIDGSGRIVPATEEHEIEIRKRDLWWRVYSFGDTAKLTLPQLERIAAVLDEYDAQRAQAEVGRG